jgi:hypothetical protein
LNARAARISPALRQRSKPRSVAPRDQQQRAASTTVRGSDITVVSGCQDSRPQGAAAGNSPS